MIPAENLREWHGHAVVDPDGARIGTLEGVYVDTTTDEPAMVTVSLRGLFGRGRRVFVPVDRAVVGPEHLKVAYGRQVARDAPTADEDGELPAEEEARVFAHYGLPYRTGAPGSRRLARR